MSSGRHPRHPARRRRRRAPLPADQGTRQAGRLLRRALPDHRFHAQQLHQLGPAPHLHRHAVQVAVAQPAHPDGLERGLGRAGRVHRDPAAAEARRRALVSRHRRRGLPEPLLHHAREPRATSSCCRAITSTRWTTRRCCGSTSSRTPTRRWRRIEVPVADGRPLRHRRRRRERPRDRLPGEADAAAAGARARPTWRWPRWASTSSGPTCWCARSRTTPRSADSQHDFGKNIIPSLITPAPVYSYRFYDENKKAAKYWRDIGTLDAYFDASMDLCQVNPEFNLYDPEWPLRTYQPQAPPAKFVFAEEGRRCGQALDSIISNGCIISGSRVSGSILCPNVRVHSFCDIEQSILMPGVRVGRHARIRRAIIDRDVLIPRGARDRLRPRRGSPAAHRHRGRRRRRDRRRRAVHRADRATRPCAPKPTPTAAASATERNPSRVPGRHRWRRSRSRAFTGARFSTRAATPRSKSMSGRDRIRPRGRAVGRVHRRARGARAARRRQAPLSRQGRAQRPSAHINGEIAQAVVGNDARSARARRALIDARRHADQEPARRQRDSSACRWPLRARGGRRGRHPALRSTSPRWRAPPATAVSAAGADDEHPQRRRARRQQRRPAGVHGDAGSACRRLPRRCAPAPRSSTRCARS